MLKNDLPKGFLGILLTSIISIVLLSAFIIAFVFPSFINMMAENSENECVRIASHIRNSLLESGFARGFYPAAFRPEEERLRKCFGLWKIIIFSSGGQILYSSDPADTGRTIKERFFYDVVARGNVYKKFVPKNSLTPRGQMAATDSVAAYVPIMKGGKFLGACEVYMDVSGMKTKTDRLLLESFLTLSMLVLGLLAAFVIASLKAGRYQAARKKAEDALMQNEYLLRTIIETEPECVKLLAHDYTVLMMNPAGLKMLQADSIEAVRGKPVGEFISPEHQEAFRKLVNDVFEGKPGSLEFKITGLKGRPLWLETNSVPLLNDQGKITAMLAITRDVTAKKTGFEYMEKSLREKETLLRELYHRTKNNMQVITSLINLQSASISDSRVLQMFDDTKSRIQAMALVHEKLYQSKDLSNVGMKDYLRDLTNALLKTFSRRAGNIALELDVSDIPLPIDIIIPCGLIVNELVSNSLKYAFPEGGSGDIRISFHRSGDQIEFTYSDTGTGLPSADLDSVKTLGLKLVKSLATKQLGGVLEVLPGPGAGFRITFKA
ncbi:MAG: PAS domain-containing protein [Nitrospiraceae bacterium]|nr:PAS domain-containing protein [Nitrospiraceae bacterium]